ncbi:hypothetical protein BGX24_007826 [Mortierella sp. AD032]|nr:hypothetical protein BGX24_007826 [Mortierella sp. AD032]
MQSSASESLMQPPTLESPMQSTSLESTLSPFPAVIPPEVLERIAFYADPHTLTICIRACRLWFACFLPPLYQNINIYHFDYFSTDLGDGYPRRSDKVIRTADTVGFGGQFIHKYGRFIETVTIGTAYALKYLLQPECVNLKEVTTMSPLVKHYWRVRGMPSDFSKYRVMPNNSAELSKFRNQFGHEGSGRLVNQIWIPLFTQNPGLRRISLNNLPGGDREVAELLKAMGRLAQLEEVYFKFIGDSGILERILDFCPQVRKITIETFINKYSNPYQTFRSRNNFNDITDEPKTQSSTAPRYDTSTFGFMKKTTAPRQSTLSRAYSTLDVHV